MSLLPPSTMPTASPLKPPISMRDADLVGGGAEMEIERRIASASHTSALPIATSDGTTSR